MYRRTLPILLVALSACAGGPSAKGPDGKGATHALIGTPAPKVAGAPVKGLPAASVEHEGDVVIVDFWATHCAPCVKAFPRLQELADRHKGKVHVVGISEDEEEDGIAPFVKRTGVSFPMAWDKDKAIGQLYKVDSMPQTFVIDRAGKVRFVHRGYRAGEADGLEDEVKQLLAE